VRKSLTVQSAPSMI